MSSGNTKRLRLSNISQWVSHQPICRHGRILPVASIESHNKLMDSIDRPIRCSQLVARMKAFYGQWLLSYSANQIKCDKLCRARFTLSEFSPLNDNHPSTMERLVLVKREVIEAKIDCYLGNFLQAWERLIHPVAGLDEVTASTRISHLAAIHCELRQPGKAVEILREEVQTMKGLRLQNQVKGRCLLLALAEALLQQNQLEEAQSIYLEVRDMLGRISYTDMITKMSNLRMWIGLARILDVESKWSGALKYWNEALKAATECGWKEGFVQMIIHYSIGHAKFQLGQHAEFHIHKADQIFGQVGRQFWWTTLATFWLDYMWEGLGRDIKVLRRL